MKDYTAPDFIRSALITIDTQNDFTLPGSSIHIPGTTDIVPNMVSLLKAYRGYHLPVIHIIRLYLPDGSNVDLCRRKAVESGKKIVLPDSHGAELVDDIKPSADIRLDAFSLLKGEPQKIGENEWIIYKPRWGAFYKTGLEKHLRDLEINTIVFCGCNYPNCPRTSIYEASERDFRIVLVKDAISQLYSKGEQEMENIGIYLLTTQDVIKKLAVVGQTS